MVFPNSGPQVFVQLSGSGGNPRRRTHKRVIAAAGYVQPSVNASLTNKGT